MGTNINSSTEPSVQKTTVWPPMAMLPSIDKEEVFRTVDAIMKGSTMRRVKHKSLGIPHHVYLLEDRKGISYQSRGAWRLFPDKLKTVYVNEILEVRPGWNTDNFHRAAAKQKFCREVKEHQCFSIIFRHRILLHKSIDLVTEKESERDTWVRALGHLVSLQRAHTVHFNEEQWLIQQFREADRNNSGSLTFSELWNLLKRLNLEISETYGKKIFERSDILKKKSKFGENSLDREEYLKFFRELTLRQELESLMALYSSGNADFLFAKDLLDFLQYEQGATWVTLDECKQLIRKFEPDDKNKEDLMLGPNGFRKLLLSDWGAMMKPAHSTVFQDMTLPLPSYFIRSSHNTYLVGGQLRGEASVEGYIIAMQEGARFLEMDVWDGSDGEPIITHGHTLVVPITLRDAVQAVGSYAFKTTPYPLILTLESHCSVEQQVKMARIFKEILGDKLYSKRFESDVDLLSPEQLKGRVLLRGKRLPPATDLVDGEMEIVTEEDESELVDEADGAVQSRGSKRKTKKQKSMPLAKELSDIMALGSTFVRSGWETGIAENSHDTILSVSESKWLSYAESELANIQKYTSSKLVKVYPKGIRTDSSNMDPVLPWMAGVQFVTMNMQTAGTEMDLDAGLFRQNGRSGYVLKPKALREGRLDFDEVAAQEDKLIIEIRVISGQYLPKPVAGASDDDVIDPYVTLHVYGLPCDCVKHKTSVIHNNGFNPLWDESFTLNFKAPELALLRVCVKDYDMTSANDFIGQYTIPVESIKPGYSHIHLETGFTHTRDATATVFVHVSSQTTTAM